jgi:hypothetical protein
MPRNPNKARCTFPGCHNWAMHDKTRCYAHRYALEPNVACEDALLAPRLTPERSALDTPPGTPGSRSLGPSGGGPAHAPPGQNALGQGALPDDDALGLLPPVSDPALPPAGNHVAPGQAFWPSDAAPADLDAHIAQLDESLRGLAVHVRRLDAQLERDPALLSGYTRLLNLQGQLASRLARLLHERQQIRQAEGEDLLHDAMNDALDQLSEEWGIQL